MIEDAAIVAQGESFLGEERSQAIAAQSLEQDVGLETVGAEALDDGRQTVGKSEGQGLDLLVGRRGQGHEGEGSGGCRHEEAVGHEDMDVGVQV
jgi:hypothetical protein